MRGAANLKTTEHLVPSQAQTIRMGFHYTIVAFICEFQNISIFDSIAKNLVHNTLLLMHADYITNELIVKLV